MEWIQIENYRNLVDVELHFHNDINYFVGENAVGKSNFLDLLEQMMNVRGFQESDFADVNKPIRIECKLSFSELTTSFQDIIGPEAAIYLRLRKSGKKSAEISRDLRKLLNISNLTRRLSSSFNTIIQEDRVYITKQLQTQDIPVGSQLILEYRHLEKSDIEYAMSLGYDVVSISNLPQDRSLVVYRRVN